MKNMFLTTFFLIISLPSFAQYYLHSGIGIHDYQNAVIKNPKVGYEICQENQINMLDQMIDQSKYNINKVAIELEQGQRMRTDRMTMMLLKLNLYKQLMGHISLAVMKDQLKTKGLYNLVNAVKGSRTESVLQLQKLNIDLEKEIEKALNRSLDKNVWSRLPDTSLDFVKNGIKDQLLDSLLEGAYKSVVSAQVRNQIGQFLAGKISRQVVNQAVRTTLLAVGKDILVSVGRGALISIVTLPLQTFTLPPEGEYLEKVKIVPEFLINPEWIRNPKNLEVPSSIWKNHCLLMARRPKIVEFYFNKAMKKSRTDASKALNSILEQKLDPNWRQSLR